MRSFLLLYEVVDDYVERRAPFRTFHLERAQAAHARGELLLAGAYGDPIEGAVLVFRCEDRSTVEAFARDDPYVEEGLVTAWHVHPWNEVLSDG